MAVWKKTSRGPVASINCCWCCPQEIVHSFCRSRLRKQRDDFVSKRAVTSPGQRFLRNHLSFSFFCCLTDGHVILSMCKLPLLHTESSQLVLTSVSSDLIKRGQPEAQPFTPAALNVSPGNGFYTSLALEEACCKDLSHQSSTTFVSSWNVFANLQKEKMWKQMTSSCPLEVR